VAHAGLTGLSSESFTKLPDREPSIISVVARVQPIVLFSRCILLGILLKTLRGLQFENYFKLLEMVIVLLQSRMKHLCSSNYVYEMLGTGDCRYLCLFTESSYSHISKHIFRYIGNIYIICDYRVSFQHCGQNAATIFSLSYVNKS